MSKIQGSVKNKIVDSSLQAERDNKDFVGSPKYFVRPSHIDRYMESCDFMDEHKELNQTHKFYDMTRQEQMKDMMMRANAAYKYGKEKWFVNHEPHLVNWAYT